MGHFKRKKNNIIYFSIRAIVFCFNHIPRWLGIFVAGILGEIAYLVLRKDAGKAVRNLEKIFGDNFTATQRMQIVRNCFMNIAKNALDVIRIRKYYHRQIKPLVDIEGLEHLDNVYNRGKGVIAVTGHIGNFELLAAQITNLGYKVAVIGRELYDKRLNRLLVENRESMGMINIDTKDSPKKILQLLREGCMLGVLIDTDSMRVRSMFVPALGKLSWTPIGQSIIGLRSGAGFVPFACVRNKERYKIIIGPEVTIERTDDFDKDVYNMTKKCTEQWEKFVLEYTDQWIWMHDRWNTQPKEPTRYNDENN